MKNQFLTLPTRLGVAMTALALAVAGCGGSGGSGGSDEPIKFASIPGWADYVLTAHLLGHILEENGYHVKQVQLSEPAPVYAGLVSGAIDIANSWPEVTHKAYMDKYGSQLKILDTYNPNAQLFMGVPTYTDADVKSIADLPSRASEFGGKVIGIEPGAGLTKLTQDKAFPEYGLDKNYKLVTSSTTAMLAELKKATDAKQPIVVTMWKPFWALLKFPVRPLEDPKGAYGTTEDMSIIAHKGFSEEYPEVVNMVSHFKLSDEQYADLENLVVNEFGEEKADQAVEAWLKDNPDFQPALEKYLKK